MGRVETRLVELGLTVPDAVAPVANYVPWTRQSGLIFVSGQVSVGPDGVVEGVLGADMQLEAGQAAARLCGLNLLAQVKAACEGDLDRVTGVVKLGGFVNAAPGFREIPQVINGCSDLMVEAFGEHGRHARAAVGCSMLPLNAAVEVEGVFAAS